MDSIPTTNNAKGEAVTTQNKVLDTAAGATQVRTCTCIHTLRRIEATLLSMIQPLSHSYLHVFSFGGFEQYSGNGSWLTDTLSVVHIKGLHSSQADMRASKRFPRLCPRSNSRRRGKPLLCTSQRRYVRQLHIPSIKSSSLLMLAPPSSSPYFNI
jgi:hypothetical protein